MSSNNGFDPTSMAIGYFAGASGGSFLSGLFGLGLIGIALVSCLPRDVVTAHEIRSAIKQCPSIKSYVDGNKDVKRADLKSALRKCKKN